MNKMLKMKITAIKKSMTYDRKQLDWKNIFKTNCFAFAMCLDIPENNICDAAYNLGAIAVELKKYPKNYNYEERLSSDIKALGLSYETSDEKEFYSEKLNSSPGRYFDVLFFVDDNIYRPDFHFARYGKDGKLYHKRGFYLPPEETTVKEIEDDGYKFVRRYRLFLSKGPKNRK